MLENLSDSVAWNYLGHWCHQIINLALNSLVFSSSYLNRPSFTKKEREKKKKEAEKKKEADIKVIRRKESGIILWMHMLARKKGNRMQRDNLLLFPSLHYVKNVLSCWNAELMGINVSTAVMGG